MFNNKFNRRRFLHQSLEKSAGIALLPVWFPAIKTPKELIEKSLGSKSKNIQTRLKFGVIGINHGHIYSMAASIIAAGGQMVAFYALEDDLAADFLKRFPDTIRLSDAAAIYENQEIKLILSSAIPNQRAEIGIKAMQHGKDYMVDKPGITSLDQLKKVKKVQKETGRIYSISYSERFENRATEKASELIMSGAIGKVIQTIGLGPHRMNPKSRPDWFFDMKQVGGIITDIGSHQFDQFLHFTQSTQASIVSSQVANYTHQQYPGFEDFGDVMVKGNGGTGYIRVDWFTPDGLGSWGDGRLTILGTAGYIEIRKNIDIAKHNSGNHLYIVNQKETLHIDCKDVKLTYASKLVDDVINRTSTAMSQEHCFLATELALKAQFKATKLKS